MEDAGARIWDCAAPDLRRNGGVPVFSTVKAKRTREDLRCSKGFPVPNGISKEHKRGPVVQRRVLSARQ